MPTETGYDADIIVLTLGRYEDTVFALRSALAQADVAARVWLLDQASPPAVRAAYSAAFAGEPRLALHFVPENLGVPGGRNRLAGFGHGRVIVALDNDAVFAGPHVVRDAVAALDAAPSLGAVGFRIQAPDGGLDLASWGYPKRLRARADERFGATTFVGAGHAIRRSAFVQAGGYDAALFFAWEEYDLSLRMIAAGWRIAYDGSLAVIHKAAAEARVCWSGDRRRHHVRNRLVIARKWGAPWLALAPRIAGYLFQAALTGGFNAALRGVRDAWARDPKMRRTAPKAMRAYIRAHETRHRGTPLDRLRLEILAPPGG